MTPIAGSCMGGREAERRARIQSQSAHGDTGGKRSSRVHLYTPAKQSCFMPTETPEAQLEVLKRGAAQIISEAELLAKLRLGRPLNVKLGVDPTAPDIHLGFTVCLQKLREFQDLGHNAILIIGDFTAMIGDPSGRSKARPQLTHGQVMENARSFQQQAYKILDPKKTHTVFNGEWFEIMSFQ